MSQEDIQRHPGNGEEPDERIMKSPLTGKRYRVTEWEDLGDGRYRAIAKEEVEPEWECPNCGYGFENESAAVGTSEGTKCIMCDRDRITP